MSARRLSLPLSGRSWPLRALEDAGLVERHPPDEARRIGYELTSRARTLDPILEAMFEWGERHRTPAG